MARPIATGWSPVGCPAPHHLTAPLRRADTVAGDTRLVHLWAGTGRRQAKEEPAAPTIQRLAGLL
ncbi:hypothetical protein GCM10014715_78180 [Streptomyces spiralis]|uniref:Uncharacterized protein n=1 Tax=Streptomyces spiralis TaxID=66376 RepID=A0A919AJS6_9ACTN|nr:hypothetical protein [Streptomyces spiralis]GHF10891.1 hypothetical protein GCM10014715_78180 [Streptomyces spiralis]